MAKFKVISTKQKEKPDRTNLYLNACVTALQSLCQKPEDKLLRQKMIFASVKYFGRSEYDKQDSEVIKKRFGLIEFTKELIGQLTPLELMNIFPPTKDFDGHKYGCKDYFSTMTAMKEHGLNDPIGDTDRFLWDYMNNDIMEFVVGELSLLSAIQMLEGEPGLMEEFAEQNGLTTYYKYTDSTGKEFIENSSTGETCMIHKKRPRYLQTLN